jgi:hypothetical protein
MRTRLRAYRKARDSNELEHWRNYNGLRNQVIHHIRSAKKEYIDRTAQKIKTSKCSQKNWWKLVNEITKFKNCKVGIQPVKSLQNPDVIITDSKVKANEFNKYFVKISSVDDNNIEVLHLEVRTDKVLNNIQTNEGDVLRILKLLDVNKAMGPDRVNNRVLKEGATSSCKPLCKLFNILLQKGHFPTTWKIAHVSAIPKSVHLMKLKIIDQ